MMHMMVCDTFELALVLLLQKLPTLVPSTTVVPSIQDLIWCVKIDVYTSFWLHRGFRLLLSYAPP